MVIQHTMGTQGIVSDTVLTKWTFFDRSQIWEVGICSVLTQVSGECSKTPERGRIINIYQSQKHFGRNGGKRIKFCEEEKKKQKTWREVEKESWENKVRRRCFVCTGRGPGKMYPKNGLVETPNYQNLRFLQFLQLKKNPKASANFGFICFLPSRTQEARKQLAISYEFTVYLLFLSRLWNYVRLLMLLLL